MWPEQVGQSLRSAPPSNPFPGSPFPGSPFLESPAADAAGAPGSPDISGCLARATDRLSALQHTDGAFEGEVVWCPMILAQYVILRRILQRPIGAAERTRMILHFKVTRRPDGGWGLHPESGSYVFVTTISYMALRLLGEPADADLPSQARRWLMAQPGGVLAIPTWGKFWLALIGLYDFRGMNPFLPELFLLPDWFPVHPNQLYCHTRYIYLAISCLYGARVRADLGPITQELRQELYSQPYEEIDFAAHRHDIAAADLYVAPSRALRAGWNMMAAYERSLEKLPPLRALRKRALARCLEKIRFELRSSNFEGVSPVNGILNTIALWAQDPDDPMVAASLAGVEYWRWDDAEDGIRFAGARSHTWDTAFVMLAILAGPGAATRKRLLERAYGFLDSAQEKGEIECGAQEGRDFVHGGWCLNEGGHRWPVSDCTAEALGAMLAMQDAGLVDEAAHLPPERIAAAVAFLLDHQNADGGFGSYERRRGGKLLEGLNPSEMFGNCMTELSYVECTGSAVTALCQIRKQAAGRLGEPIERAIDRGCAFLRRRQRDDGSYAGFWGINFTYATCFAVTALRAAGAPADDPGLVRAATWLAGKQKPDGGWGEHYSGCLNDSYVEHPQSQPTMTSWALLALLEILGPETEPIKRGVEWLCRSQQADGSWPNGAVNGVFFGSAMLTYRLYPTYFPIWALNRYLAVAKNVGPGRY
jgi:2,3-oxidosqualene cyclase